MLQQIMQASKQSGGIMYFSFFDCLFISVTSPKLSLFLNNTEFFFLIVSSIGRVYYTMSQITVKALQLQNNFQIY